LDLGVRESVDEVPRDELHPDIVELKMRIFQGLQDPQLDLLIGLNLGQLRARDGRPLLLLPDVIGVGSGDGAEGLQELKVLLAVAAALLLRALLVEEALADDNPPLPIGVQQLDELHALRQAPEVVGLLLGLGLGRLLDQGDEVPAGPGRIGAGGGLGALERLLKFVGHPSLEHQGHRSRLAIDLWWQDEAHLDGVAGAASLWWGGVPLLELLEGDGCEGLLLDGCVHSG
jgi:hypothetical protein